MKTKTKVAKFDALEIKNGALDQEGKFIAAQIKAMRGYETAAEEKAGVELKKAQDNRTTVEKRLADVHSKCKADGFKAFRAMYAPDFGRTKLYQILAIGYGKKTIEQVRTVERDKKREQRAAEKSSPGQTNVPDNSAAAVRLGNGEAVKTDGFSEAAKEQLAKMMVGNDTDAAASAEQRKAENAAAVDTAPVIAETAALAPEEISDDELTAAKAWWREHGPNMTDADVAKYRVFISDERQWRPRGHKKAA